MQTTNTAEPLESTPAPTQVFSESTLGEVEARVSAPGTYKVIRRNGKLTQFDEAKITVALSKAFLAVEEGGPAPRAAYTTP